MTHPSPVRPLASLPVALATLALAWLPSAATATTTASGPGKISFNRDVRPILSDQCFACHGFDAKKRKADLRLDVAEGAYKKNDDGSAAIKPGDLNGSTLWQRISTTNEDDIMPPADSHKKLTAAQRDILKRWIEQGAEYQAHWSFITPALPKTPAVRGQKSGFRNAVDEFILARLEDEGLAQNEEADKETLIRRVTFDLTGLPPTIAEVDAFLADNSPRAYEHVVDRLLKSPRYGEHMARYWLDLARYGDTHGLHLDNERSMWPYRDWVVQSFNDNQHFDDFTRWQLAGDLLPNATREQQIASGFNRCNVTTSEGGSINEEFVYRYAVDRTASAVEVWMGLTAGCAVCHDHKFDPISQKEFYSLYAFFNSAADPAMDGNILLTPPTLRLTTAEQQKQLSELDARLAQSQGKIRDAIGKLDYKDPALQTPPPPVQTSEVVWFDDEFPAGANVEHSGGAPTTFVTADKGAPVQSGKRALKRTAEGVAQDFFSSGAKFDIPPNGKIVTYCYIDPQDEPKAIMLQFHTTGWNHRAVWGQEGAIPFGKVRTPEKVTMGALPATGEWVKLEIPAEKVGLKPGMKVTGYAFTQYGGTVSWDRLSITSRVEPAKDPQWSWKVWGEKNQGKRVEGLPNDLLTLVRGKKPAEWPEAEVKRLKEWWFENEYQGARSLVEGARGEKLKLESQKKTLDAVIPATLIMADLPQARESFVMMRGQYDKPGEKVTRGTPAFLPALPKRDNYTRLDFADWLVSAEHPLTARVAVNRFWQQFFGTGLVKTSGDFGSQGEPPSHPELLDWLAITFRESGWDVKALVKLFVTSGTYRQGSRVDPPVLARDPENRLHARGARFRLDAEVLRDNALFTSGLMTPTIGGKGVRPYQPPNIWEPVGFGGSNTRNYVQDHGEALYRRSLYTFIKRTAPPPFMATFDAPNREQVCTRRERSNTPLQALQLMNDIQHYEAARNFAQRMILEGGSSPSERITWGWRVATSRKPNSQELAIVEQALQQHLSKYRSSTDAANLAVSYGESKRDEKLDVAELAAYALVANLLLNLDETVTKN
jgi:hypothetical protein